MPLLRRFVPRGDATSAHLALDMARDLIEADATSPYTLDELSTPGVVFYQAPDAVRLVATRSSGEAVELRF